MQWAPSLKAYGEAFLRLLYPPHCGVCRLGLTFQEQHLCAFCAKELTSLELSLGDRCLDTKWDFISQAWALYPYESPLREVLTAVKFQQKRWLLHLFKGGLKDLGSMLAAENPYDAIIPVPLERGRLLQREFNQAEIIANFLAETMSLPVRKLLKKRYRTAAQSGLSREERKVNLLFAFEPAAASKIRGKSFLLADDIQTTGATADEAARTLLEQGAKQVDLVTIAYTPEHSGQYASAKNFTQNRALWDTSAR